MSANAWVVYYSDMTDVIVRVFPVDPASPDQAELDARRAAEDWQKVMLVHYGEEFTEAMRRTREERAS